MIEFTMYRIMKRFGDNLVLNNITFTVYDKERVALVGRNGCGKSTILKLLAGIEPMDRDDRLDSRDGRLKGWIKIPKGVTVGYLNQLPEYAGNLKVIHILKSAFEEVYTIEKNLRELENTMSTLEGEELERVLKRYSDLQEVYITKGGYDIEEKLSKICKGLKFDDAFLNKDFNILSGGEKTTVSLGKILLENPDILLLDEPTNHLDMDSIEWLEGYLRNYNGIVMVVSHDRYFLDNVVTKVIEIENKQNTQYDGNYSDYVSQKEDNMLEQFKDYKDQQSKIKAMESAVKRLRSWEHYTRAASIQKKLDKLDKIDKPVFKKQNIKFDFKDTERSGSNVIKGSKICKSFNDKVILSKAELNIYYGERVALIGPNGSGKTTFLKMLLGNMNMDSGILEIGANVKHAYLPQEITFSNEDCTVIECFREDRNILEGKAREYLSKFMFFGKTVYQKVKHLSGGEKVRLKLSMLLYDAINLLILDEPTNHLDIESIETLETALEDFNGTIFFISHDRYFINKVCDRIIALEDNKLVSYSGNYDFYKNSKLQLLLSKSVDSDITKKVMSKKPTMKPDNNSKKSNFHMEKLDHSIKFLEEELREIHNLMDNCAYNYEELAKLYAKKEELSEQLEDLLSEWINSNSEAN
ncbi:ABC-F family ATP-binding cassette domain-containing protein [Clostridium sp. UBA4548]|uniref:ABC-F family ATP-binding cassette domain-containing protein n=1 Tax=Clostridium sp. UBA4548 TaxID=1946361 RepID=UPI0025C0694C|nr:ABC-F family ATP-binding cassette domain-containing protein [Clostridium sp. UBA4548]